MDKIQVILEGLNCAHCAAKIEKKVNDLQQVSEANMNFTNKVLTINVHNNEYRENVLKETKKIVNTLEPDVKIIERCDLKDNNEASEGDNKKTSKLIRLIIGIICFGITFFIKENFKLQLGFYTVSYFVIGADVLWKACRNIIKGQVFDENFLMAIATIGAISIQQYPEAVAVMMFYQVGESFQDYAVNRSRKSISALIDIRPEFANLKTQGNIEKVLPKDVKVGDTIIVKPGEKVPLDGMVVEGQSFLDTSILTGESVTKKVTIGEEILSGVINKTSVLEIKVTKNFENSAVSKILELVENASSRKPPIENFITKFARYYTPIIVLSAVLLAVIPPLIIKDAIFSDWLYRALIFLVVSCPCALVVSIPLGFFGGIGAASRNGILVKGGNYLEALNNAETVVFDKTGTLTQGVFNVSKIEAANNFSNDELLELAAKGEYFSNHPIAKSIIDCYGKSINKDEIKKYEELSGKGITAILNGKKLLLGNKKLMNMCNINYSDVSSIGTVVHVALEGQYCGYIIISDNIKKDSKEAILGLKKLGIKNTVMLTGDNKNVANKVSEELQLDKVYSELLPENKVEKIEEIFNEKSTNGKVLFVGDGVNDAPVLARADIGIAMGGLGSDAAIEAADVVIMTDEPSKIISAIRISRKTKKIVWQNIILALGIKFIVLVLGVFGVANMWEAVFADVGVALIAVINSMRALSFKE